MSTPTGLTPPRVPGSRYFDATGIGVAAAIGAIGIAVDVSWWMIAAGVYLTAAVAAMVGAAVVHTYQHHRRGRRGGR